MKVKKMKTRKTNRTRTRAVRVLVTPEMAGALLLNDALVRGAVTCRNEALGAIVKRDGAAFVAALGYASPDANVWAAKRFVADFEVAGYAGGLEFASEDEVERVMDVLRNARDRDDPGACADPVIRDAASRARARGVN